MILTGDALTVLKSLDRASVRCIVTSPPYYGLRDYGHKGQLGLEASPDEYVARLVEVFREARRVLTRDGTMWLNMSDSYGWRRSRERRKNLLGIPWRTAFALQADGWNLRQEIIWAKPAPMPESVKDRFTRSHESIFLKRDVWTIPPEPYRGAHFATFPAELARTCIKAGSARGDTVLDMFSGSGTVGVACILEGREYIGIELNPDYVKLQEERLAATERTGFLF